ncbi:MAG: hypothetical protein PHS14_06895 [Elusimicrobia bacterium]|nr:hypothetical protein [Elusimicrobiota bacterium]
MRHLKLLLVLILAVPLPAVAQTRTGLPALPLLPGSAIGSASAVTTLSPVLSLTGSLSAPSGPLSLSANVPTPTPQIAVTPAATPAHALPAAANEMLPLTERLDELFKGLDAKYFLPEGSPTAKVRARVRAELLAAARDYADPEPELMETVAREADKALVKIQDRINKGMIDPSAKIRVSESDPEVPFSYRPTRVGVYPVAADPFQWGHLLIALRAVGELSVDKVVFVLAGDDPRKPTMTPVEQRHPMGQEVLGIFAPFFEYSPIAVGTTLDGETNIFRILALNPQQGIEAWYMVGDDHYKLVDKNGNPDTLPKLERNYAMDMGHNTALHQLKVAFINREAPTAVVPTGLEVRFLDHVGFEASSTQVRNGHYTLMPHTAYDFARQKGLYGVPPAPVK